MPYTVVIPKNVQKDLAKIDQRYQGRISLALVGLANNPYSGKKLEGEYQGQFVLRVWPYRIIYEIRQRELVVLIIRIGHRPGGYK